MKAKTKDILSDVQKLVNRINKEFKYNLSLEKKGMCWYIDMHKNNTCLNGYWGEEDLTRMYDQTAGFFHALADVMGA